MRSQYWHGVLLLLILAGGVTVLLLAGWPATTETAAQLLSSPNPTPPTTPVRLIFIHHSTGENWLADDNGGLGIALRNNNYFVSDTNYGWGPDSIGDTTDIGHWWNWFRGDNSATYLAALYTESAQNSSYSRLATNPGGENRVILFKSCFPNSYIAGNPTDPPTTGDNPLRGQDASSEYMTVANVKGIYNDLLTYFATRQDKLFVLIVSPPQVTNDTDAAHAANARAVANWLINDWLDSYPYSNVAVFDFFNVLTSNGGNVNTNDLGWTTGNHHRWWNNAIQHVQTVNNNYSAYGSAPNDSHPTAAGNRKATAEFLPLLNIFYNHWREGQGTTPTTTQMPTPTVTRTATPTSTGVQVSTPTRTATPTIMGTVTPTRTPPAGQQTMIFQQGVSPSASYAGATDTLLAYDFANINLGGAENVEVFYGETEQRRSLLRWDLSALPAGITVNAATVELYRYDGEAANVMPVALYRATRAWSEGTGFDFYPGGGYTPDGATWTLASPGVPWTTPGGDFNTTIVGQTTLPAGMSNRWVQLDATAAVRAWVEQSMPNYGVLIRPLSGDYTYHYFYSRNYDTPSLRPRLVITYTTGTVVTPTSTRSPSPTVTPTRTASTTASPTRTATPTSTHSPSSTVTPTRTGSATVSPTRTATPTSTSVQLNTPTPTTTPSLTPRLTVSPTPAPAYLYLPLIFRLWSPPAAATPTQTNTATLTPTRTPTFTPTRTNTPGAGSLDVPLTVRETAGVARNDEPVTSGVPIPASLNLTDLSVLRLLDANGQPVPAQFTPLARWGGAPGDSSKPVRWLLVDFQVSLPANGTATYRLVNSGGPLPTFPALTVTDGASALTINTGATQFTISKTSGNLTAPGLASPLTGRAIAPPGTVYTTTGPVTITVSLNGPMRVSVQVKGSYRNAAGARLLDYTSRYWFYAGQPTVRLFHTVENNNLCPLAEYEQLNCFNIGSGGSITMTDLSLILPTSLSGALTYQAGGQGTTVSGNLTADLRLYQDSSGTDQWNRYPTMTDWEGRPLDTRPRMQAYVTFRGYRTTLGATLVDSGNQAAGWLSIAGANGRWSVGVRDFWQNFPKALRASPTGRLEIGLFPDEFGPAGYGFNLRAGEHKTHEVWFSQSPNPPISQSPLFAAASPAWYVNSGAFGLTALPNRTDWPEHEQYIDYQLTTSPEHDRDDYFKNLPDAIQHTDFYGIFDYGDWPIDYEGYEVAPLNPKYDNDYGMWLQWARGGDARWFGLAQALDRHVADIDILHNLHNPRHWGDGIIFGHSGHDEAGFLNPHRNENSGHPDIAFGLPGLLTTYYLTGYEKAYEAALELANCLEYRLHNDDHLCRYFSDCNGMGYALGDNLSDVNARSAANSLMIVTQAYRATADPRYLAVANALVDWADPVVQPFISCPAHASGAMRPWQLNMYLRALASYLDMRSEFGLADTYNARGDFLAYANWLRTCPWLNLTPITTGPRAAYPYEWWFDGRTENREASINNWLLLGADVMAYAYRLSGTADYLDRAARLFRTGSHDPWFEGDLNFYAECKETINSISFGHTFLYQWAIR